MTAPFTRRDFLKGAAGATALGLGGYLSSDNVSSEPPFDTVVVLMMENRSFDHMLGWLPGANGRQHGLTYPDRNHVQRAAWPLGDDVQGCDCCDPDHTWRGIAKQYNDGACDGFLQTALVGDTYPMGYYVHVRAARASRKYARRCRARRVEPIAGTDQSPECFRLGDSLGFARTRTK